ncbi:DNA helicase [Ranunculus cassubicifolius]
MLNLLLEQFPGANDFGSEVIPGATSIGMRVLKEGCLIILTRNVNPRVGLCNGTRLICNKFYHNLIDAEIVTGSCKGQTTFIPKITLKPSADMKLPFSSTTKEFPIRLLH